MEIDDDTFVVNSTQSIPEFGKWVRAKFEEFKYLTFTYRVGEDRSLSQNSILHVWLTLYAAHLAKIDRKQVSTEMVEFIKTLCKKQYYTETGAPWMITRMVNPAKPKRKGKIYYRSSADYKHGEMFQFLTWLQMKAAQDGLVLESTGQYAKLQRQHLGE